MAVERIDGRVNAPRGVRRLGSKLSGELDVLRDRLPQPSRSLRHLKSARELPPQEAAEIILKETGVHTVLYEVAGEHEALHPGQTAEVEIGYEDMTRNGQRQRRAVGLLRLDHISHGMARVRRLVSVAVHFHLPDRPHGEFASGDIAHATEVVDGDGSVVETDWRPLEEKADKRMTTLKEHVKEAIRQAEGWALKRGDGKTSGQNNHR